MLCCVLLFIATIITKVSKKKKVSESKVKTDLYPKCQLCVLDSAQEGVHLVYFCLRDYTSIKIRLEIRRSTL